MLPEFLEFSVEWFAFGNSTAFEISGNVSGKFLYHLPLFSSFRKFWLSGKRPKFQSVNERLPFVWKTRNFRREFKLNGSSRLKFSGKKEYLSRYYLFPVLTETTEIFCTICFMNYQCQASCREKVKNLLVFCKWYNSIPFLFLVPKKENQYQLTENFSPKFPYKW